VYRPKVKGRETDVWWLDYGVNGERYRESARTKIKSDAQRLLRQKLRDRETGKVVGRPERVTFGQLRELVERAYILDGRRSSDRLQNALRHLEKVFGTPELTKQIAEAEAQGNTEAVASLRAERVSKGTRAMDISSTRLDRYAEKRLAADASRSTVNYELAVLRRSFRLAIEKGLLTTMPVFDIPKPENRRTGFFSEGDFAALMLELSAAIRPLVQFLWFTGWRRDEGRLLMWEQVDWEAQTIRIDGAQTKSGEPRVFPFGTAPALRELLESQWKQRDGLYVFHEQGHPIGTGKLRCGWKSACKRTGLEGRLVHDLRRSAARNMRAAGMSESDIMELCGWETREMFKRYCIKDEKALALAVAKRFGNGKTTANIHPALESPPSLSSGATP
jgi:integrase